MAGSEERRLITVMFADVSGFMSLSQRLDPEEVKEVMDLCFAHLNPLVTKHGGVIHKYEGDSVIALFGLPVGHEDDPERAVLSALEMLGSLPALNQALADKLRGPEQLSIHIGTSSGTVFVGEIGSKEKREYTVMGEVVNLASRLKDTARSGQILVSESVYRLTHHMLDYEMLAAIPLKGIEDKVKVFLVRQAKREPEPKRGVKGLVSPLVGRDKELQRLQGLVARLAEGAGGAVFIMGDPGLGKTRLWFEVKDRIITSGLRVGLYEGRCFSYGENLTYHPLLQMVRAILELDEKDTPTTIEKKMVGLCRSLMPDTFKDVVPYLGVLLGTKLSPEHDEKVRYLDARDLKRQVFAALKKLLQAIASQKPLVVVIEDYHWADLESLEFVEHLFDGSRGDPGPILLVGLSRVNKESRSWQAMEALRREVADAFCAIRLEPLTEDASRTLVDNLLHLSGITDAFRDRILSRVGGNPFFLEEVLRALITAKIIVFESGVWKLMLDISTITIPDTVQLLIASRLDQLEHATRSVLQQAAVVGRVFDVEILENLTSLDSLMLSVHLAALEEFEFIRRASATGRSYQFRHALVHEVAYSGILKKARREMHRCVGEIIERIYHDRLDDHTELLAYQYGDRDDSVKAIEWLSRAGVRAKERYANEDAVKFLEKAILLLPERGDRAAEVYELLGDVRSLQGNYGAAKGNFEAMFVSSADRVSQSRSMRKIADVYLSQSNLENALKIAGEALALLEGAQVDVVVEKAEVAVLRAVVLRLQGEMSKADEECRRGLKLLDGLGAASEQILRVREKGLGNLGAMASIQGNYDEASGYFEQCLQIGSELADKRMIGNAVGNLGIVFYHKHDYERAIDNYERFLRLSGDIGDKKGIGRASNNLGLTYRLMGKYDAALRLFQNYMLISKEIGDAQGMAVACGNMGPIHFARGEYAEAEELFRTHLQISEETGEKRSISVASHNLGFLYYELQQYDKAITWLERDLAICNELGDKRGAGIAHVSLARLLIETGDLSRAEQHLQDAETQLVATASHEELVTVYNAYAEFCFKGGRGLSAARAYVTKAFQESDAVQSKAGRAASHLALGRMLARAGDFTEAETHLARAVEMRSEIAQDKHLAEAHNEYASILEKKGDKKAAATARAKAAEILEGLKRKHNRKSP